MTVASQTAAPSCYTSRSRHVVAQVVPIYASLGDVRKTSRRRTPVLCKHSEVNASRLKPIGYYLDVYVGSGRLAIKQD